MGNTVPPRASREATGAGRRGAGTGRRCSENVTEVAAPPATPSRVVVTARKQGQDDDGDGDGDVEEEETTRAGRPRAGRALRASGGDRAAPGGKVLTVKIVMTRKDAEALVARLNLKAQTARERKARMAELKGELRAGSCGGGRARASPAWSRVARRPMLPPIKENRFERITPVA